MDNSFRRFSIIAFSCDSRSIRNYFKLNNNHLKIHNLILLIINEGNRSNLIQKNQLKQFWVKITKKNHLFLIYTLIIHIPYSRLFGPLLHVSVNIKIWEQNEHEEVLHHYSAEHNLGEFTVGIENGQAKVEDQHQELELKAKTSR